MFVSTDDETLIKMRAMGGKKFFALERASNERYAGVHYEGPHQERAEHQCVAALIGRKQGQDSKGITKKRAGNIAHEYFCRRPVMKEKTQTAGRNCERDPKCKIVLHVCRKQHPSDTARKSDSARHTVNPVHKIVGIGQTNDPQKGDYESHYAEL